MQLHDYLMIVSVILMALALVLLWLRHVKVMKACLLLDSMRRRRSIQNEAEAAARLASHLRKKG